ncbi:MAG: hypothetical protein VX554_00300 [Candidatus Thermoplasmatota archaeon]|nr:hypothetical protein [Euryarchaeota archaeon]MDP6489797.1 hypothetical protein [Candidatus Poseidoniia archaeon]MDP6533735.1 hypothetical protein [Candidatus Poseidoniia archaeon]MEC8877601.1 hypothetical protein [Candidatus Thermoplasmatota archaeon]MEE3207623.1 hypothetical protein [Candidatus Thermoplasmatota archaeon]
MVAGQSFDGGAALSDIERLEALEVWLTRLTEFPGPVIVEGQRDIVALQGLCDAQLLVLNNGHPVLQTVETLARKSGPGGRFAILTDWDRTGGRLARQLRALGIASDLQPDSELRRELVQLARHEISCVEELPSLLQKLRPK